MAEGEGNKPPISFLEQQEKRRTVEPSETPAPYVQPYRPASAGQPLAQQLLNSAAQEAPFRSYLGDPGLAYARTPLHPTYGAGFTGLQTSGADGLLGATMAPAQLAQMLAYMQQQLTQLQQVHTLLSQNLQLLQNQNQSQRIEIARLSVADSISAQPNALTTGIEGGSPSRLQPASGGGAAFRPRSQGFSRQGTRTDWNSAFPLPQSNPDNTAPYPFQSIYPTAPPSTDPIRGPTSRHLSVAVPPPPSAAPAAVAPSVHTSPTALPPPLPPPPAAAARPPRPGHGPTPLRQAVLATTFVASVTPAPLTQAPSSTAATVDQPIRNSLPSRGPSSTAARKEGCESEVRLELAEHVKDPGEAGPGPAADADPMAYGTAENKPQHADTDQTEGPGGDGAGGEHTETQINLQKMGVTQIHLQLGTGAGNVAGEGLDSETAAATALSQPPVGLSGFKLNPDARQMDEPGDVHSSQAPTEKTSLPGKPSTRITAASVTDVPPALLSPQPAGLAHATSTSAFAAAGALPVAAVIAAVTSSSPPPPYALTDPRVGAPQNPQTTAISGLTALIPPVRLQKPTGSVQATPPSDPTTSPLYYTVDSSTSHPPTAPPPPRLPPPRSETSGLTPPLYATSLVFGEGYPNDTYPTQPAPAPPAPGPHPPPGSPPELALSPSLLPLAGLLPDLRSCANPFAAYSQQPQSCSMPRGAYPQQLQGPSSLPGGSSLQPAGGQQELSGGGYGSGGTAVGNGGGGGAAGGGGGRGKKVEYVEGVEEEGAEEEGAMRQESGGPDLETRLNANRNALLVFPDDENTKPVQEGGTVPVRPPWYRRTQVFWFFGTSAAALVLTVVGVCLQTGTVTEAAANAEVFRWLYFVAGFVPIYWGVFIIVRELFHMIERFYFLENIFYLQNIKANTISLISLLLMLLWFRVCFKWAWCSNASRCSSDTYRTAVDATWRALLCIMLLALANLVKAVLAKICSMHFYRTAHFKKLREVLEMEYYLKRLSEPRSSLPLPSDPANGTPHADFNTVLSRPSAAVVSAANGILQRINRNLHIGALTPAPLPLNPPAAFTATATAAIAAVRPEEGPKALTNEITGNNGNSNDTDNNGNAGGVAYHPDTGISGRGGGNAEDNNNNDGGGGVVALTAVYDCSGGGLRATEPSGSVSVTVMESPRAMSAGQSPSQLPPLQLPQPPQPPAPPPPPPLPPVLVEHPTSGEAFGGAGGDGGGGDGDGTQSRPTRGPRDTAFVGSTETLTRQQYQHLHNRSASRPTVETDRCAGGDGGRNGGGTQGSGISMQGTPAPYGTVRQISGFSTVTRSIVGGGGQGTGRRASIDSTAVARGVRSHPGQTSRSGQPRRLRSTVAADPAGGAAAGAVDPQVQRRLAELGPEAIDAVPLDFTRKKDVQDMTEAELSKLRDTIVIKTCAALIRKLSGMSEAEQQAEAETVRHFAHVLYCNIRGPDVSKTQITLADMKPFFWDKHTDMATKAFEVFDKDKDGKVSESEVLDRVMSIYAERRNIVDSLRDTESIVRSLELTLGAVIHFLFVAIYLAIWGVPLLEGFSAFAATVLALTFIFGNAARTAFESVLFLFMEHPYDVGDMVYIDGESMRVKRISLMYTDFVKWTNEEVYIPNNTLMATEIINWTRTRTKFELHKILVDVGISWEVKQDICNALAKHCENNDDFTGAPRVTFREVVDPLKIYLGIGFTYNFPPDDFDRLIPARDKVMYVVQCKLAEHKLQFSHHSINHVEADQEIQVAMQMRQLQAFDRATTVYAPSFLGDPGFDGMAPEGLAQVPSLTQPQGGPQEPFFAPSTYAAKADVPGAASGLNGTSGPSVAAGPQRWVSGGREEVVPRDVRGDAVEVGGVGGGGGGGGAFGSGVGSHDGDSGGSGGGVTSSSVLPALGAAGLMQRSTVLGGGSAGGGSARGFSGGWVGTEGGVGGVQGWELRGSEGQGGGEASKSKKE